jgi:hypothetical protein
MTEQEILYGSVGGKPMSFTNPEAPSDLWDFGWIPPEARNQVQEQSHHEAAQEMPRFAIEGKEASDVKKVCLFDIWNHPLVVESNGFAFPGIHQLTGSCVGAGGGNVAFTLASWEVVRLNDPEIAYIPFWLLPYGRSRYYLGDRGRGEGSTGSTFAKAAKEDGFVKATHPGLPKFTNNDGLVWGSSVEYSWSDGDDPQTMNLLPESRKHLVQTTARCRNADEVRQAICNGFPCTEASMYGFNARVEGEGSDAVLIGRRGPRWSHQMGLIAWWEHPKFGELFFDMNQWGQGAHGKDPSGGPAGGVWIPKADVEWICQTSDEVYAFSQFQGFPSQKIPWLI